MGNKQNKELEDEKKLAIQIFHQYFNEHPNIQSEWCEEATSKHCWGLHNKLAKIFTNKDNYFVSRKYFANKAREILNGRCQSISNYSDMKLSFLIIDVYYNKK